MFKIALRKYFISSKMLDGEILKVLEQQYVAAFWSENIMFNLITIFKWGNLSKK